MNDREFERLNGPIDRGLVFEVPNGKQARRRKGAETYAQFVALDLSGWRGMTESKAWAVVGAMTDDECRRVAECGIGLMVALAMLTRACSERVSADAADREHFGLFDRGYAVALDLRRALRPAQ